MIEYASDYTQGHKNLLSTLAQDLYHIRQTYSSPLFRGVSLHLNTPIDQGGMATKNKGLLQLVHPALHHFLANPAVRRIYPVYEVARPQWFKEGDRGRRLPFEDSLSQIDRVHRELGLTGTGMTVGILDSGTCCS